VTATGWPRGQPVAVTDFSKLTALAGIWHTRAAPGATGQNAQCNDLDNAHASALVVQAGAPANASIHAQLRLTSQGADLGMGLLARVNAAGTNYYLATLSPSSSVVDLRKVVNGAATQLASVQIAAAAFPDWPQLRLDVTGDQLQVFADGKTVIDVKDPSLAEGGVGLWAGAGSTACFGEVYVQAL